jgi:LDH2 family malate/lactate/ureidoglycolate dehydrogenase
MAAVGGDMERVVVAEGELRRLATDLLVALGVPAADAALTADVFLQAELMGEESHGLRLLPHLLGRLDTGGDRAVANIVTVVDRGAIAVWDAQRSLGQVTAARAMAKAVAKARDHGIGLVSVRNGNSLTSAKYYALQAAAAGMIGVVYTNTSRKLMPPPSGKTPVLGNNPFGFAAPAGRHGAFFLDMAMTTAAVERIVAAKDRGESIPQGWATDVAGVPTTDPSEALASMALTPFGGAKAFGLGMVHEILTSVLNGGALFAGAATGFLPYDSPMNTSFTVLAVDIAAFQPVADFERRMEEFLDTIKAVAPVDPAIPVRVPGERSRSELERRRRDGIPIHAATYAALRKWQERLRAGR